MASATMASSRRSVRPSVSYTHLTESFAQLPVRNPNGTVGINIHLDAGSARSAKYNLGGGNEVAHEQLDNTMTKWAEIRSKNMDPNRESVFHYMIWGDAYDEYGSSGLGLSLIHI